MLRYGEIVWNGRAIHDSNKLQKIQNEAACIVYTLNRANYSRTSMARTSLGLWKIFWDMGSSSHRGLIMVQGQEEKGDNFGKSFRSSIQ